MLDARLLAKALGNKMNLESHTKYFLTLDGKELEFENFSETREALLNALNSKSGKILFAADDGLRPWWQRFIFGARNYIRVYFALEWSNEISGLIFYDENASEFRALSDSRNKNISDTDRKEISFGESEPLHEKYCITTDFAQSSIVAFLEKEERPEWHDYEFVR